MIRDIAILFKQWVADKNLQQYIVAVMVDMTDSTMNETIYAENKWHRITNDPTLWPYDFKDITDEEVWAKFLEENKDKF